MLEAAALGHIDSAACIHHRVNMYVAGQVLTSDMSVNIFSLIAPLQVDVSAHHPPLWLPAVPNIPLEPKQLSGSHSPSPVSTATFIYPRRRPTHSFSGLDAETTNTPHQTVSSQCVWSVPSLWRHRLEFSRGRDLWTFGVTWFHISVSDINRSTES